MKWILPRSQRVQVEGSITWAGWRLPLARGWLKASSADSVSHVARFEMEGVSGRFHATVFPCLTPNALLDVPAPGRIIESGYDGRGRAWLARRVSSRHWYGLVVGDSGSLSLDYRCHPLGARASDEDLRAVLLGAHEETSRGLLFPETEFEADLFGWEQDSVESSEEVTVFRSTEAQTSSLTLHCRRLSLPPGEKILAEALFEDLRPSMTSQPLSPQVVRSSVGGCQVLSNDFFEDRHRSSVYLIIGQENVLWVQARCSLEQDSVGAVCRVFTSLRSLALSAAEDVMARAELELRRRLPERPLSRRGRMILVGTCPDVVSWNLHRVLAARERGDNAWEALLREEALAQVSKLTLQGEAALRKSA
jgi:hypothetical protein